MRTTLTLDDDVAARIDELRRRRSGSFKALVNEALRQGLAALDAPKPTREPYVTPTASLGGCLIGSIDDVSEVLAVAEDEGFR